jgi:tetratricopeptide (TPR) repeat protein
LEGENEEALPLINESITLDPYNGWAYRNKGYYYLKKGNADEALRLFQLALNADPRIDKLHLWMAEAAFLKGDREGGCRYLLEAANFNQISSEQLRSRCP